MWFVEAVADVESPWVEINGRRIDLFETPPEHSARTRAPESPLFERVVRPALLDPTQAWRIAWIDDAPATTIADPLVARWSAHVRARWDEAARRLGGASRVVLRRVEHRLPALGTPYEAALPVWSVDRDEETTLLRELLDPDATAEEIVGAGEAWLARTQAVLAWVADARPLVPEGRLPSSEIGLLARDVAPTTLELTSQRGPARLTPAIPAGLAPEFVRLPIAADIPADIVIARRGAIEQRLGVVTAPISPEPPAFVTGDFYRDHTRASFGTDALPPPVAPTLRTRASLTRLDAERWRLTVECLGDEPGGRVELWLGDRRSQSVTLVRTPRTANTDDGWSRVEPGRWIAAFDFSIEDHLDRDGLLRLAMVRTDAVGLRQAWPRPMTPGQTSPGRLAFDPTAWGIRDD